MTDPVTDPGDDPAAPAPPSGAAPGASGPVASALAQLGFFAVVALVIYGPSGGFPYVFDDVAQIRHNPVIRSLDLGTIFTTPAESTATGHPKGRLYRPLGVLSFALNHAAGAESPWAYRVVDMLLHALAAFLVVRVARRLGVGATASSLAGLLFLVHPVHVEAVVQIKGRFELLAALGALGMVLAYPGEGRRGPGWTAAALACFTAALLSKEGAFGLLLMAPLLEVTGAGAWGRPGPAGRALARGAPRLVAMVAIAAALVAWRVHLFGSLAPATNRIDNPLVDEGAAVRAWTALEVLARYVRLLVLPVRLSADYSYATIPARAFPAGAGSWLGLAAAGGLVAAAVATWRRPGVAVAVGLALVAAALAPVSNVLIPVGTIMGERLLYLPAAGAAVVAGLGLARLLRATRGTVVRRSLAVAAIAGLVCLMGLRARDRIWDWRSDEALYRTALAVVPDSAKMLTYVGGADLNRHDAERAIERLEKAVALAPEWVNPAHELARAYVIAGHPGQAIAHLETLRERGWENHASHYLLGLARLQRGEYLEAAEAFGHADGGGRERPAAFNRAYALLQADATVAAAGAYAEAIDRFPDDPRLEREGPRFAGLLGRLAAGEEDGACPGAAAWARAWQAALAGGGDAAHPPALDCPPPGGGVSSGR